MAVARGSVYGNQSLDARSGYRDVSELVQSGYDTVPYHSSKKAALMDENKAVDMFKEIRKRLSASDVAEEYARINGTA